MTCSLADWQKLDETLLNVSYCIESCKSKITCVLIDHLWLTHLTYTLTRHDFDRVWKDLTIDSPWQLLRYLEVRSSLQWGKRGAPDVSFAPWTSVNAPSKMSDLLRKKVRFLSKTIKGRWKYIANCCNDDYNHDDSIHWFWIFTTLTMLNLRERSLHKV